MSSYLLLHNPKVISGHTGYAIPPQGRIWWHPDQMLQSPQLALFQHQAEAFPLPGPSKYLNSSSCSPGSFKLHLSCLYKLSSHYFSKHLAHCGCHNENGLAYGRFHSKIFPILMYNMPHISRQKETLNLEGAKRILSWKGNGGPGLDYLGWMGWVMWVHITPLWVTAVTIIALYHVS